MEPARAVQGTAELCSGTILVLRHHQPQVLAQLSALCSEDELSPLSDTIPCQAKPSEHLQLHTLAGAFSFSSAPAQSFARSPYRGDISSIPWCLFCSARAGNGANYCVTSCSLKGIRNEADRIGLSTVQERET